MTFSLLRAPLLEDWSWIGLKGREDDGQTEKKERIVKGSIHAQQDWLRRYIEAQIILIFLFSPFSAISSSLLVLADNLAIKSDPRIEYFHLGIFWK